VRRRELADLERWMEQHPVLTRFYTVGFAILTCELALLLRYLAEGALR
jgi:hypothetical protein